METACKALIQKTHQQAVRELPFLASGASWQGFRQVESVEPFVTSPPPQKYRECVAREAFLKTHSVQAVRLDDPPKTLKHALDRMAQNVIQR